MPAALALVSGYIPSPNTRDLTIGPLTLHLYGLCIAMGVVAAVVISSRRWEARGGNPDDIATIALWAVPAGVIGARIYHVVTDWKTYSGNWGQAFHITQGGLGIPGGILFGVLAGLIVVRVKKLPAPDLLDVVAPAIPVAQAIGRLGNWFNQELYGRPTTLPWGLKIDNPRPGYERYAAFHPTFLYEALWNLGLAGVLVLIDRRKVLRKGELFALYVLGYSIGRFFVEELRIDKASLILGFRVNTWTSSIGALGALGYLVWNRAFRSPESLPPPAYAEPPISAAAAAAKRAAAPASSPPAPAEASAVATAPAPTAAPVSDPTPAPENAAPGAESQQASEPEPEPTVEPEPEPTVDPEPETAAGGPPGSPPPVDLSMVDHPVPGQRDQGH